ncbi:MAG: biopolymer transporter ExbD [Cryobacterium sp.]|nr:biopolymer transporter ExbD [Oligoflexia bacterium]
MAGAARSGNDNNAIVEINVIPLVDIILVVLIIFMVAAPLVMQPKIDISLPKASTAKDEKDKIPLKVVLGKKGELFLNNNPISVAGLTEESKRFAAKNPETAALLVADKDVTLEMVTDLVDAIKIGGVKKVAFSIQRKK